MTHTPPFTLLLIQHSHTDVGYTALQPTIAHAHARFLRQALEIHQRHPDAGFRWTSETFWAIEQYWRLEDSAGRERLLHAIREGVIGLSGSYLNFSELADLPLLRSVTGRARAFADAHGLPAVVVRDRSGVAYAVIAGGDVPTDAADLEALAEVAFAVVLGNRGNGFEGSHHRLNQHKGANHANGHADHAHRDHQRQWALFASRVNFGNQEGTEEPHDDCREDIDSNAHTHSNPLRRKLSVRRIFTESER